MSSLFCMLIPSRLDSTKDEVDNCKRLYFISDGYCEDAWTIIESLSDAIAYVPSNWKAAENKRHVRSDLPSITEV